MEGDAEKRVLILGKLCRDNTTVVNTLLNNEVCDEDEVFISPKTEKGEINGLVPVKLTITPGIMEMSFKDKREKLISAIKNKYQKGGFHIVIVTESYPFRWTDEQRDMQRIIEEIVGKDDLSQKGCLVVLVNASNLMKKSEGPINYFNNYIQKESKGGENSFAQVLSYFTQNQRYICLDGETMEESINNKQLERFIEILLTIEDDPIKSHPFHDDFEIVNLGRRKDHVGDANITGGDEEMETNTLFQRQRHPCPRMGKINQEIVEQFLQKIKVPLLNLSEDDWCTFCTECEKLLGNLEGPTSAKQYKQ